jgi:penicillin-binding protein 2
MIGLSSRRERMRASEDEAALFRRRALAGFLIIATALAVLVARFGWLQWHEHAAMQLRSDQNRIKLRPLPPSRGLIYDRTGRLLAENVLQSRLELVPEQVRNPRESYERLATALGLGDDDRERFNDALAHARSFDPVPIKLGLTEDEVDRFALHRHEFPGVEVTPYLTRAYPHGEWFAHAIGYVGRIDVGDRDKLDESRYAGMLQIGKSGVERYYEDLLLGQPGYEEVEVDAAGRSLRVLGRVPPHQGQNLYLSIDAHLQQAAYEAFDGQTGAAVAIDPATGEVLAWVSVPSFDPNLFIDGISRANYAGLMSATDRPMFNRPLQGGFEPGSTVKPFMGLAGLELGLRKPSDTVVSTGVFSLPGSAIVWKDWRKGGHGVINLREALAQSVNTYFYRLAVDMGVDNIESYLGGNFGFGRVTGVDLYGESSGVIPSRSWKRLVRGQDWFPGETVIAGIGQGYWVVTPLQLANATAILAAGGVRHTPHLLRTTQDGMNADQVPREFDQGSATFVHNPANLDAIREGMLAVVHSDSGTAHLAMGLDIPYRVAGKSGTAQRFHRKDAGDYNNERTTEALRHRAWFICYAPADHPTIALAVVLEHGGSGSHAAAPVARKILDAWLLPPGAAKPKDAAPAVVPPQAVAPPAAPTPAPPAADDAQELEAPEPEVVDPQAPAPDAPKPEAPAAESATPPQ